MMSRQPLVRRIVTAFTLMTLVVSGVFSLGIVAIVHFVEEQLVSREMSDDLDSMLQEDLVRGLPPRLGAKTQLYTSHPLGYEIPLQLADRPEGFSELDTDDKAAYVFVRDTGTQRYVLVQDQAE
ncbi:MAG: hypothetical protein R6W81_13595, partial [Bacteroidales bacterium]